MRYVDLVPDSASTELRGQFRLEADGTATVFCSHCGSPIAAIDPSGYLVLKGRHHGAQHVTWLDFRYLVGVYRHIRPQPDPVGQE